MVTAPACFENVCSILRRFQSASTVDRIRCWYVQTCGYLYDCLWVEWAAGATEQVLFDVRLSPHVPNLKLCTR